MLAFLKKILFALFLLLILVLVYENLEALSVKVPFVFDAFVEGYRYSTPELPVWILFALFFLLGMLAAGFHGIYERMARRAEIRKRDKRIRELEKEIGRLRVEVAELRPPTTEPEEPTEEETEPQTELPELPKPASERSRQLPSDEEEPTL